MKAKTQFAVATLFVLCAVTTLPAADGDLPYYGSQLKDLDAVIAKSRGKNIIIYLEESGGFRANINVLIQSPFPGTMKEYIELSRREFDQLFDKKWKMLSEKQEGEKEWFAELVGTRKGEEYHFYSRAVKEGDKVYQITATATQKQWGSVEEKLRRHVNAFRAE